MIYVKNGALKISKINRNYRLKIYFTSLSVTSYGGEKNKVRLHCCSVAAVIA